MHVLEKKNKVSTNPLQRRMQLFWLLAAPVAFIFVLLLIRPTPALNAAAIQVLAVAIWMVIWWIFEPVPIPVTSLLPLILFPLLGFSSLAEAALGYANRIVYLFLGGFMMAIAIEKHNIHYRLALSVLYLLGKNPRHMLLGFILTVGFLSMWFSNTATTVMMLPIALAVVSQLPELLSIQIEKEQAEKISQRMAIALLLAIAYSASIGGMATLIGTPPNAILAGSFAEQFGIELSFARWMVVGFPLSIAGLAVCYIALVWHHRIPSLHLPELKDVVGEKLHSLGKLQPNQILVSGIFMLAVLGWLTRSWLLSGIFPRIDDAAIAMIGAVLMLAVPQFKQKEKRINFVVSWQDMSKVPWGILLLFGGGFSLAAAFSSSGLSGWIGTQLLLLGNLPIIILLTLIVIIMSMLTQLTSNAASTTLMMPILGSLAVSINTEPLLLMGGATLAASAAFMLPVATPPNAIVFSSGRLNVKQMLVSGAWLNLLFLFLVVTAVYFLMRFVLN